MPPYSKCNIKNKKEERNFSSFLSDLDTLRNAKHINNIDTLRPMPAKVLTSYIATSARNAALTYIRNISRRKEILADEFDNSNVDDDHDSDPEVILLKSEEINSFAKIWDELDDKTKFLLSSRYILEKSYLLSFYGFRLAGLLSAGSVVMWISSIESKVAQRLCTEEEAEAYQQQYGLGLLLQQQAGQLLRLVGDQLPAEFEPASGISLEEVYLYYCSSDSII